MKMLKLEEMTLEQKIGQLICARGYRDEADKKFVLEMIKKGAVGAVQGICNNDSSYAADALAVADYPILICADMEGGVGDAIIPRPMGITAGGDPKVAYELGRATAIEAKRIGINLIWGPVVDLREAVSRSFSYDKDITSEYAIQMLKGYQDEGLVCTAKHFVGAKDVGGDSHMKKVNSERTLEELMQDEMVPYFRCMEEGNLSGIMTKHTLYKNIDDKYIVSLSKKMIDVIRSKGFDGLIVTDSLAMMGIVRDYGLVECLGIAIAAGNDMVLPNYRLTFKESFDYLMEAYKKGVFDEQRLNEAVRHVLEAQEKTLKKPSMSKLDDRLKNIIEESWKNSVVGIVKDGVSCALSKDSKKFFAIFCENTYVGTEGFNAEIEAAATFSRQSREKLKEQILKEFPDAKCMILCEWPNVSEGQQLCVACSEADEVVFFTFAASGPYLGTNCLTRRVEAQLEVNKEKIAAVVHNGNPFEINKFRDVDRIFTSTAPERTNGYILKALKGEFEPKGKLTVNLDKV